MWQHGLLYIVEEEWNYDAPKPYDELTFSAFLKPSPADALL
jgi:hypothetical protein